METAHNSGVGAAGSRSTDEAYVEELESAKQQLLVIGRNMSEIYHREKKQARALQGMVQELRDTYLATVETLAFVVEARDECTRNHLERCREYGMALAEVIDPRMASPQLEYGFLLHDVGKVGIPEAILGKPGPLTEDELRVMRTHPILGVQIVAPLKRFLGDDGISIIRHHHERFDGSGYPDGLREDKIPLAARVFQVVDAFDAMTSDRPYRKALSFDEALHRLRLGAGSQFDPEIVTAFEKFVVRLGTSTTPVIDEQYQLFI